MKKGKKIAIALGCTTLAVAIGTCGYFAGVREKSKSYNLITLDTSDVPSPVTIAPKEYDVELSEITMHYAVYGNDGHPLILVHGNGGNKKNLSEAAAYLANDYTVYVIESRCHGGSTDAEEISYDLMAKDIKEFIEALNLKKPYLVGHSDGGINAITIAYTYPELLGGFISCGANSNPDTLKPSFTWGVKIKDMGNSDKLNALMLTEPDFTKEKLSKITCPAYIVAGEHDIMWLSDTAYLYENIPNSKVAIIKGGDHSSYISQDGKQAYALAHEFFKELR